MQKVIFYFNNIYLGNWLKIYNAIYNKEKNYYEQVEKLNNLDTINITDSDYPTKLRQMYMPPFILFYKGNKELISKRIVTIIGDVNKIIIEEIIKSKSDDFVICVKKENVSDENLQLLIKNKIKTIIFCDCSIRKIDNNHQDTLLYLSEFNTEKIDRCNLQIPERIMYALSDNLYLNSLSDIYADLIAQNYENEQKTCFINNSFKKEGTIFELIDKKILNPIRNLKELFDNTNH